MFISVLMSVLIEGSGTDRNRKVNNTHEERFGHSTRNRNVRLQIHTEKETKTICSGENPINNLDNQSNIQ